MGRKDTGSFSMEAGVRRCDSGAGAAGQELTFTGTLLCSAEDAHRLKGLAVCRGASCL